eukprot:scaffold785_cov252-Ochromonas_danica.AAC.2
MYTAPARNRKKDATTRVTPCDLPDMVSQPRVTSALDRRESKRKANRSNATAKRTVPRPPERSACHRGHSEPLWAASLQGALGSLSRFASLLLHFELIPEDETSQSLELGLRSGQRRERWKLAAWRERALGRHWAGHCGPSWAPVGFSESCRGQSASDRYHYSIGSSQGRWEARHGTGRGARVHLVAPKGQKETR